jgi:mannose-6-phosphate isomerase
VFALTNTVQAYPWGAPDGVADLVGRAPSGGPEAELWIGSHPAAPSRLDDGRTLDAVEGKEAEAILGAEVVERFGVRLPFLLKLLAIGAPLSIQLHPSAEQAEAGFTREEASGRARDDPGRSYRDAYAKPEVLVAVRPMWVLAGLRPGADAAAALRGLDDPAVADLARLVADAPDARDALIALVTAPEQQGAVWAQAASSAADEGDPALGWVSRLARQHPGDPTALVPLVLRLHRLEPGDGVFLPAGVPHAYLDGAGVELMGASDNVVRGGLTSKHVDEEELVALLAPPGTDAARLAGDDVAPGTRRYAPGVAEITLHRIDPAGGPVRAPERPPGPALAFALGAAAEVASSGERTILDHGRAALVPADEREGCVLTGPGTVWWATIGDVSPGA